MNWLTTRIHSVSAWAAQRCKYGRPVQSGESQNELLIVLDGVGGFQFSPLLVRRALRQIGSDMTTILFDWHFGLPCDIWHDLMWLRRNRVMGRKLAQHIIALRRRHPHAKLHLFAVSGGCGVGIFALEALGRLHQRRLLTNGTPLFESATHLNPRPHHTADSSGPVFDDSCSESNALELPISIDTFVLACPALSPQYNLAPALRNVAQAIALVSHADSVILGWGTKVFGTVDRVHDSAAGRLGFVIPTQSNQRDRLAYRRLRQAQWSAQLLADGCTGGHTSWSSLPFLRKHLLPLLQGVPLIRTEPIPDPVPTGVTASKKRLP